MSINGIEQFMHAMPEIAQEQITERGISAISLGAGINRIEMAGHDRGVPYRFFMHPVHNPTLSEQRGYEVFEEHEMIEWFVDRRNKPTEYVKFLPEDLIKRNRAGDIIGGRYKDAYLNWKSGKEAPGTPLRRWGLLSDAQVATLEAEGVFTVEQYAEMPRDRVASRFPDEFIEAYDRAAPFLAAKDVQLVAGRQAEENEALRKANEDLAGRLAKLEALLEEKTAPKKAVVNKLTEGKK